MTERSILPRLIAALVGLIIAFSLVLTGALMSIERTRRARELREAAVSAADHLALSLAFPAWNVVEREIDSQLEAAMLDPSLYGIVFAASDLVPALRAWTRDSSWKPIAGMPDLSSRGLVIESRGVLHDGRKIAELKLAYSDRFELGKLGGEAGVVAALILGEAAALALGLLLILRSSIIRPLRSIERWAVGIGDSGMPPPEGPDAASGEIESLRRSIIKMVGLLDQRYKAIEARERENESLIQELFHRTRNSLQLMASFIALREGRAREAGCAAEFGELERRIRILALAQEGLIKAGDLSLVDLADYLRTLLADIASEAPGSSGRIRAAFDGKPLPILIDAAVPVGLIAAELAINSVRHAFPGDRPGAIAASLERRGDGTIALSIMDDGVGPPPGFDPRRDASLGLETVFALSEGQLRGNIGFDFSAGFRCDLRFDDRIFERRV